MSEFLKMMVWVDKHGIVFGNSATLSQTKAANRVFERIKHGKFVRVFVNTK